MSTRLLVNEYIQKNMPEYVGLTLIPKYWHPENEDLIYCECVEKPELSNYIFYLWLEDWSIRE